LSFKSCELTKTLYLVFSRKKSTQHNIRFCFDCLFTANIKKPLKTNKIRNKYFLLYILVIKAKEVCFLANFLLAWYNSFLFLFIRCYQISFYRPFLVQNNLMLLTIKFSIFSNISYVLLISLTFHLIFHVIFEIFCSYFIFRWRQHKF
jgi:hypothetical protein